MKHWSETEILNRLYRYCAYQERATFDIVKQLRKFDLDNSTQEKIINRLKEEGFVDDTRYASIYVAGKLRNNQWGKIKIVIGLKAKNIDPDIISKTINEIDESEYHRILIDLVRRKDKTIHDQNLFIKKHKIARFVISRGFESTIVWEVIQNYFDRKN